MSPEFAGLFETVRVILYHKQATSARTLFLRHADGGISAPASLPPLAVVLDEDEPAEASAVAVHPASLALALCEHFGLPPDSIEVDPEFSARVDVPGRPLTFHLARFKAIDPPRSEFAPKGGRFYALTELRGCAPAEMELLRRAYAAILGG